MAILVLIPLCCLYLGVRIAAAYLHNDSVLTRFRRAILYTILFLCLFSAIVIEGLSMIHAIGFVGILGAWITLLTVLVFLSRKMSAPRLNQPGLRQEIFRVFRQQPFSFAIALMLLVSFCLAVIYPTNNYDSQTYHMARVAHYIQNRSVADYPTHIIRQLIYPPLAEWLILHLQLLLGSDKLANAVQTFFFAAIILQVSLVAQAFQGSRRQQFLAAVLAALIPMAVLQSNTTQNDLVASYFALAFVYCIVLAYRSPGWFNLVTAGVSLGLAVLTKGTAYLFCGMFCLWLVFLAVRNFGKPLIAVLRLCGRLLVVPVIALVINSGHYSRNISLTGSPLGITEGVSNSAHNPKALAFVAWMNFMNHMPVTSDYKQSVKQFAARHGVDLSDPVYNFNPIDAMMEHFSFHEDYAQNFWHTCLILLCLIIFLLSPSTYRSGSPLFKAFAVTLFGIAILFCVLFKWQPWSNRLETPLFMFFCVFLGVVLGRSPRWVHIPLVAPAVVFASLALARSPRHPIFPLSENICHHPYNEFIYSKGMVQCQKYFDTCTAKTFGLVIGADAPDYPMYKLMTESKQGPRLMQHMFVDNVSAKYEKPFLPDAIISIEAGRASYTVGGRVYVRTRIFDVEPALFEPKD